MVYLAVSAFVGVLVILYANAGSKNRRKKQLEKIRNSWGVPKSEELNFNRIARYAHVSRIAVGHTLSQQTLDDIDFQQLFAFIDRTTSAVGQQYLFRRFLHPFHYVLITH